MESLLPSHTALVVRTLIKTNPEERKRVLQSVDYNIFAFPAALVTCDFLSDSGTSAMTDIQWAAMLRGDESYGRNTGYYCLLDAFRDIFERGESRKLLYRDVLAGTIDSQFIQNNFLESHEGGFVNGGTYQLTRPNFFILPQGRCAEALLFSNMMEVLRMSRPEKESRPVIISNGFFDTTGANASAAGFELKTLSQPGLRKYFPDELIGKENHFKGNLDIDQTKRFLVGNSDNVALLLVTITNNYAAAQPVSMENIRQAAELAKCFGIPIFFDACRFAENAKFIKDFEQGYADHSISRIIQEMFSYVDGFTISLKKDAVANIGGVVCFRDGGRFAQVYSGFDAHIGLRMKEKQILTYGNDSYGALSGRDLMAASVGLYEGTKEAFLSSRIGQVQRMAQRLRENGIPMLLPPGGHAIYLDMVAFFSGCHREPHDFASVGFTVKLLEDYGIRAFESGPFAWEFDKKTIAERETIPDLVRFAMPRNAMSFEHINYTITAITRLYKDRDSIPNMCISRGAHLRLRHFSCGLIPIYPATAASSPSGTKRSIDDQLDACRCGSHYARGLRDGEQCYQQARDAASLPKIQAR
ncbi:hypothetical protein H2200_010276 [Cladophialophora chaetospira]|uniref:Aromatic amino acid beta-eliminating lyase/threonine aldolase domain-containing protein n=1 Tax=Cladophialophora chaetospira TaxID=386627 RepID=A0AA38X162_9EURO|nr:hypothetical protein H2200_010276 [Cladophialophora chaetospira]